MEENIEKKINTFLDQEEENKDESKEECVEIEEKKGELIEKVNKKVIVEDGRQLLMG